MWLQHVAVEGNPGSSHSCGCSQTCDTSAHAHEVVPERRKHPGLPFFPKSVWWIESGRFQGLVKTVCHVLRAVAEKCSQTAHTVMLRHQCHQVCGGCLICKFVSGRWFLSSRNGSFAEYSCLSILSELFIITERGSKLPSEIQETQIQAMGEKERGGRGGYSSKHLEEAVTRRRRQDRGLQGVQSRGAERRIKIKKKTSIEEIKR